MTSLPLWVKRRCAKSENLPTQNSAESSSTHTPQQCGTEFYRILSVQVLNSQPRIKIAEQQSKQTIRATHELPITIPHSRLMAPSIVVMYGLEPSDSSRYRHSYGSLIRPVTTYCDILGSAAVPIKSTFMHAVFQLRVAHPLSLYERFCRATLC